MARNGPCPPCSNQLLRSGRIRSYQTAHPLDVEASLRLAMPFVETSVGDRCSSKTDRVLADSSANLIWSILLLLLERFEAVDNGLRMLDNKLESYFSRPRVEANIDDILAPQSASAWLRKFVTGQIDASGPYRPFADVINSSSSSGPPSKTCHEGENAVHVSGIGLKRDGNDRETLGVEVESKKSKPEDESHSFTANPFPQPRHHPPPPLPSPFSLLFRPPFSSSPSSVDQRTLRTSSSSLTTAAGPPRSSAQIPHPAHNSSSSAFRQDAPSSAHGPGSSILRPPQNSPPPAHGSASNTLYPPRDAPPPAHTSQRQNRPPSRDNHARSTHLNSHDVDARDADASSPSSLAQFPRHNTPLSHRVPTWTPLFNPPAPSPPTRSPSGLNFTAAFSQGRSTPTPPPPPPPPPHRSDKAPRSRPQAKSKSGTEVVEGEVKERESVAEEDECGEDDEEWKPEKMSRRGVGGEPAVVNSARSARRKASLQAKAGIKKSMEAEKKDEEEEEEYEESEEECDDSDRTSPPCVDGKSAEGYRVKASFNNNKNSLVNDTQPKVHLRRVWPAKRDGIASAKLAKTRRSERNRKETRARARSLLEEGGSTSIRDEMRNRLERRGDVEVEEERRESGRERRRKATESRREFLVERQRGSRAAVVGGEEVRDEQFGGGEDDDGKRDEEEDRRIKEERIEYNSLYPDSMGAEREHLNSFGIKLEALDSVEEELTEYDVAVVDVKPVVVDDFDGNQSSSGHHDDRQYPPSSESGRPSINFICSIDEIWCNEYEFTKNVFPCKVCSRDFFDLDCLKFHMVSECKFIPIH